MGDWAQARASDAQGDGDAPGTQGAVLTQLTVKINEADLAKLHSKLGTSTAPALERLVHESGPFIRDQTSAGAPVSTGALAGSLVSEVHPLTARVYSPLEYALPQEFGRHGGSVRSSGGRGAGGRFFLRRAVQMFTNSELPRLWNKAISELEAAWKR